MKRRAYPGTSVSVLLSSLLVGKGLARVGTDGRNLGGLEGAESSGGGGAQHGVMN